MNISISTKKKKITAVILAVLVLAAIIWKMCLNDDTIKNNLFFDEFSTVYVGADNWSLIAMDNNLLPVTLTVTNSAEYIQGNAGIRIIDGSGLIIKEELLENGSSISFPIPYNAGNYRVEAKAELLEGMYCFRVRDY